MISVVQENEMFKSDRLASSNSPLYFYDRFSLLSRIHSVRDKGRERACNLQFISQLKTMQEMELKYSRTRTHILNSESSLAAHYVWMSRAITFQFGKYKFIVAQTHNHKNG